MLFYYCTIYFLPIHINVVLNKFISNNIAYLIYFLIEISMFLIFLLFYAFFYFIAF